MTSDISPRPVSPLRARMIEDMTVRGFKEDTRRDYVRQVRAFAAFIGRSPDTATAEDLRLFQLHQTQSGMQPPSDMVAVRTAAPQQSIINAQRLKGSRTANSFAAYVAVSKLSKRLPMPFWQRSRQSGWRRLLRRQISWPKRGHRNGSSLNWNLSAPVSRPAVTGVNMMQSSQKIALWQGLSNTAGMRRWRV